MRPDPHKKRRSRLYMARKGIVTIDDNTTIVTIDDNTTIVTIDDNTTIVTIDDNTTIVSIDATNSDDDDDTYDITDLDLAPQFEKFTIKDDIKNVYNIGDFLISSLHIPSNIEISSIFTSIPLPSSLSHSYFKDFCKDNILLSDNPTKEHHQMDIGAAANTNSVQKDDINFEDWLNEELSIKD